VERPGHPCVAVRQVGRDVELTQRRFTFVPGSSAEPPWPIPLRLEGGDPPESILFDSARLTLRDRDPRTLRIDPGRTGFFRLLWAPELRAGVIADLPSMPSLDRRAFVHDAYAFLVSGDYSLEEYLAILHAVTPSTDRPTVEEVAQSLDFLEPVLGEVPSFRDAARRFLRTQIGRLTERTAPGEPESTDVVRDWVLWLGARLDPEYARNLAPRFETVEREPPAVRQAIMTAFAQQGSPDAVDRLMAWARGPDSDAAVLACLALGDVPGPSRAVAALDEALASVPAAPLFVILIPSIARNPAARTALWSWWTRHLRELERRALGAPLLSTCAERTIPTVGLERSEEVRAYFEREKFPGSLPGIARGIELLDANERLQKRVRVGRAT